MNLTKNQVMIIAVLIVAVIAYYMFFRKPKATTTKVAKDVKDAKDAAVNAAVVATQEAEKAKMAAEKAESAYAGLPPTGVTATSYADAMMSMQMPGGASFDSSYDGLSSAPTQQEMAGIMGTFSTDWLDINK